MGLLKKIGGFAKKAVNAVNPLHALARDAVSGKGVKKIGKNFVDNSVTGAKGAAVLAPVALSGGAGAGLLGAGGGAGAGGLFGSGLSLLDAGLGVASGIAGYDASRKQGRLQDKALKSAEAAYLERAPLRKLGLEMMLNQQAPDLTTDFANPSNPFARPLKRTQG